MVMELKTDTAYGAQDTPFREHAGESKSKRVVDGPVVFANDGLTTNVSAKATVTGTTATIAMLLNKKYRFISTVACCFKLSSGGDAATISDIYLPANQPIIIQSGTQWRALTVIKFTGASDGVGFLTEVL